MIRYAEATIESFPIAGSFTISRGSKTSADVVVCTIREGGNAGRGECVPYRRYGETIESVMAEINAILPMVVEGMERSVLQSLMKPGAARNAVDCALWDLEAKKNGLTVMEAMGLSIARPLVTAYTISLGSPEEMAAQTAKWAHRKLLKVKVGTEDDESRIRAVRAAAPDSAIVIDANEGWTVDNLTHHLNVSAECGIGLIEQPLPAGQDELLARIPHPVPICADESAHETEGLELLRDRYDAINIKLDKAGGLTEALKMKNRARELGYEVMVGCMVGTSLAMAPAVLLAQDADFVDLDGPLLLARDRTPGLVYDASFVLPPAPALWG
ncbi:L-alanine-DL-glutamate epimerase-like enolase superfamily enzyme [Rhizobium aquaticum]|uniref:Dipeptide epimerase n=1 Tax=Rhizobium aquaticum TaxID=1549636 RepID=A0ABV2IWN2_9HYPH